MLRCENPAQRYTETGIRIESSETGDAPEQEGVRADMDHGLGHIAAFLTASGLRGYRRPRPKVSMPVYCTLQLSRDDAPVSRVPP